MNWKPCAQCKSDNVYISPNGYNTVAVCKNCHHEVHVPHGNNYIECPCGKEIPLARVQALVDITHVSEIRCITCAEKNPVPVQEANFKYDGGSNDGERPRHW